MRNGPRIGAVGVVALLLAACSPGKDLPATVAPTVAAATAEPTSGATALAATTGPATPAATAAGSSLCDGISALKASLDALAQLDPETTPKSDLTAAVREVGQKAVDLITAGGASKSAHLQPLQFGASVTMAMISGQTMSEVKQSIQQELNTGNTVLQELGTC